MSTAASPATAPRYRPWNGRATDDSIAVAAGGRRSDEQAEQAHADDGDDRQLPHPVDSGGDQVGRVGRGQGGSRRAPVTLGEDRPSPAGHERDEERAAEQDEADDAQFAEGLEVQGVGLRDEALPFAVLCPPRGI